MEALSQRYTPFDIRLPLSSDHNLALEMIPNQLL
jgi:hypothetical protein